MNITPLVSIIIPTFNRGYIIQETLNSVRSQSYKNWECIIVDDGSTDNTKEIVNDFLSTDVRFKFFERPINITKGPSACRNFGFERSKGEYIQWFDSDDLMHPEKLKIKLEFALKHKADVIIDKHSEDGLIDDVQHLQAECFTSEDFYIEYILGKRPVITNDVMLKRTIIGGDRFDENLWKGEEYEFYSRVFQQKLIYCFLDVALTRYRISVDSISIAPNQAGSLIYLSKIMQQRHIQNNLIVERARRQGRKTYENLVKRNNLFMILKHFNFFRKAFHKRTVPFFFYMLVNFLIGRGFDHMKPKKGLE